MELHRNAKLGLAGRRALVEDVCVFRSCRRAAQRHGVCATTASRWHRRWQAASAEDRASGRCFEDRSSRPLSSPRQVPAVEAERICRVRQLTGWGPRLIAGETGHPHATVSRCLQRAGLSRLPRQPREAPRRYEWPCPGDLLHIDTKRFARFGITPKRLMSDNAWIYTKNASLARLLAEHDIRHLLIPSRRPQVNGKVERYQQTLKREWALGHVYRTSEHRADALTYWLRHYNEHRPHSALGGRPPTSRVHNLSRQDI
jgi:transposase InsO family protein